MRNVCATECAVHHKHPCTHSEVAAYNAIDHKHEHITYLSIVVNRIGCWSIDLQLWLSILSNLADKWYSLANIVTFSTVYVIHFEESNAILRARFNFLFKRCEMNMTSFFVFFVYIPFSRFHTNCFLLLEIRSCCFKIFFVLFFFLLFVFFLARFQIFEIDDDRFGIVVDFLVNQIALFVKFVINFNA